MFGLLVAGPRSALYGVSAAQVWEIDAPWTTVVHVAAPPSSGAGRDVGSLKVHRPRLPASHVVVQKGFAVTIPARTLVDMASQVEPDELARAVDSAFVRGLASPITVRRVLDRIGHCRAGVGSLRAVLGPWDSNRKAESPPEMWALRLIRQRGLPEPVAQMRILDEEGRFLARPDYVWPEAKVIWEVDGRRWHGTPAAYERDQQRANELLARGWLIARTTPQELETNPDRAMAALWRLLESRISCAAAHVGC